MSTNTNNNILPEFSLAEKAICVTSGACSLGLTQSEALLDAGAIVYALDRLEEPVLFPSHTYPQTYHNLTQETNE